MLATEVFAPWGNKSRERRDRQERFVLFGTTKRMREIEKKKEMGIERERERTRDR